jgi:hypothetical protein
VAEAWVRTRRQVPVFTGPSLARTGRLHFETCRGKIEEERETSCSCSNANTLTSEHAAGILLEERGEAALVQFRGFKPTWVERRGLTNLRKPPRTSKDLRGPPADFVAAQEAVLREGGPPDFGRRRRPPRGGEIVFVREQARAGFLEPWRYLCLTRDDTGPKAVLIRPELSTEQAFAPTWSDVTYVDAPDFEPARTLFPAFPLPDGTPDPGWVPTDGEPVRMRRPRPTDPVETDGGREE